MKIKIKITLIKHLKQKKVKKFIKQLKQKKNLTKKKKY